MNRFLLIALLLSPYAHADDGARLRQGLQLTRSADAGSRRLGWASLVHYLPLSDISVSIADAVETAALEDGTVPALRALVALYSKSPEARAKRLGPRDAAFPFAFLAECRNAGVRCEPLTRELVKDTAKRSRALTAAVLAELPDADLTERLGECLAARATAADEIIGDFCSLALRAYHRKRLEKLSVESMLAGVGVGAFDGKSGVRPPIVIPVVPVPPPPHGVRPPVPLPPNGFDGIPVPPPPHSVRLPLSGGVNVSSASRWVAVIGADTKSIRCEWGCLTSAPAATEIETGLSVFGVAPGKLDPNTLYFHAPGYGAFIELNGNRRSLLDPLHPLDLGRAALAVGFSRFLPGERSQLFAYTESLDQSSRPGGWLLARDRHVSFEKSALLSFARFALLHQLATAGNPDRAAISARRQALLKQSLSLIAGRLFDDLAPELEREIISLRSLLPALTSLSERITTALGAFESLTQDSAIGILSDASKTLGVPAPDAQNNEDELFTALSGAEEEIRALLLATRTRFETASLTLEKLQFSGTPLVPKLKTTE